MNIDEIESFVARISYKPDFYIEVGTDLDDPELFMVRARAILPDVHPNGTPGLSRLIDGRHVVFVYSHGRHRFDQCPDETMLRMLVEVQLHEVEKHEFDEWFRVDGKTIVDPHPELAK